MRLEIDQATLKIAGTQIVQGVSLTVPSGSLVGLLGPNGSGKSTLLRAVYRMLKPTSGYVRLGDADVWQMNARASARKIGVVVQESSSEFQFTVREVVHMGRTPHKGWFDVDTADDDRIVTHALERVEMMPLAERIFATLSGGEKQRVLIARVLAQQPRILVLDEPTNHLDIQHQIDILELVQRIGITTLVTLHDLNLAAAYCHTLYLLYGGRIVAQGTPEQILTPDLIRHVFRVEAIPTRHPITQRLQLAFMPLRAPTSSP